MEKGNKKPRLVGQVVSPGELARMHPLEHAMTSSILAKLARERGVAWVERNRELLRGQIEQVMGPLSD